MRRISALVSILICAPLVMPAQNTAPPNQESAPPKKAPKIKSRLKLLQQMQADLDKAAANAKADDKQRKKLAKCHEMLVDAIAQQQHYKSVNNSKIHSCLKELEKLEEQGIFTEKDRAMLQKDREDLEQSIPKPGIHLPKPL